MLLCEQASGAAATPTMFSVFGKAMGSLADSFVDVTVSVGNEMANVWNKKNLNVYARLMSYFIRGSIYC